MGNTTGATNDAGGTCSGASAPDHTYVFSLSAPQTITLSLCGSSYDTVLYVRTVCNSSGTQLACSDDFCGVSSQITLPNLAAGFYYVFVDGWGSSSGNYTLAIRSP